MPPRLSSLPQLVSPLIRDVEPVGTFPPLPLLLKEIKGTMVTGGCENLWGTSQSVVSQFTSFQAQVSWPDWIMMKSSTEKNKLVWIWGYCWHSWLVAVVCVCVCVLPLTKIGKENNYTWGALPGGDPGCLNTEFPSCVFFSAETSPKRLDLLRSRSSLKRVEQPPTPPRKVRAPLLLGCW